MIKNKDMNGRLGVVKKELSGGQNITYRIMFHLTKEELAISVEYLELLKDCQYTEHDYSSPVLVWPANCKTDVGSLQSLKMFPELNTAAENYYNLIFNDLHDKIVEITGKSYDLSL